MKIQTLAVCALALALPFATHQAMSAPASSCASASVSIVTGTDTVAPGTTIGIVGRATNCSAGKKRYTISFSAMSDCGQKASLPSSRIAFGPGESFMFPVSYPMPYDTCPGPWVATVEVSDQGGVLASGSTTITVQ